MSLRSVWYNPESSSTGEYKEHDNGDGKCRGKQPDNQFEITAVALFVGNRYK